MFDILVYLNLYTGPNAKDFTSKKLMDLLGQYLIVKTLDMFPDEKVEDISNPQELFDLAKKEIPNFDKKVQELVIGFKEEYKQELGMK